MWIKAKTTGPAKQYPDRSLKRYAAVILNALSYAAVILKAFKWSDSVIWNSDAVENSGNSRWNHEENANGFAGRDNAGSCSAADFG
jgi:hypothetical protein